MMLRNWSISERYSGKQCGCRRNHWQRRYRVFVVANYTDTHDNDYADTHDNDYADNEDKFGWTDSDQL